MSKSEFAIVVRGIMKNYGKAQVLKGVDFEIPKGSVFCLLGSNGAGKTTMIRILTTLLEPNAGEAQICGYDVVKQAAEVRRRISLTGQYAAVDELLTARENLIMTGKLFHMPNSKECAKELLSRFNLTNHADKKVSAYSGGMRRRLDIAMSLSGNPEIVFLDEPTTGLDPQNRIEMWRVVRELAQSGMTIFLTTQYLEEAERLADTIAILHDGRIVKSGTPDSLKSLIAGNRLTFNFKSAENLLTAKERLSKYAVFTDMDALYISVETDGSMNGISTIIDCLSGLDVISVEQKKANLEDVFLRFVTTGEEQ